VSSNKSKDKLVEIFNRHLRDTSKPYQTQNELVFDVVADYIHHLMMIGNVPHFLLDTIETDLKEEVIEIYLKKTYGHRSLMQFRQIKFKTHC